ncbi:tRNA 2-thiouridine(34) synthase MnmA [Arsenicicoccus piscis]|uniref:tRNA-specific 2-thiouridylase MnmA n=1 Tax=Arsenicicoccus piscis TaxID=673954 RepID=A0ABQ6HQB1_9MICO|nr:tRNA 2-thiouridine(34) synthase MnmA [Arsenicicoccus piscis]MCH8628765.1 tRNA 2-thiouridine(34) synthase MnmA [Arsenicicoccus piscis]GMA20192.1 tRNA-specific 2-thiouridylase MnmA [Arsenicicoccus piscis]
MARIVAAMSGGVDSAVAAARMLDAGHQVVGVHLALSQSAATLRESARGCCTIEDAGDARRVADRLVIPFYVWDMAERFAHDVVEDFVTEYSAGRTPNPCLRCNEKIKFAALLDKALALGFDGVATGHYAQVEIGADGTRSLHRAVDPAKDQSYVLGVLDAEQLERSWFPLGDSTKDQIRAEAAERGLAVAKKPDSHDICFIADGDTKGWLAKRLGEQPGDIVDTAGEVVGSHSGAYAFTVGQRRGLRLGRPTADGAPRYVVEVDVPRNTVVVGTADLLGIDRLTGTHVRWTGPAPVGRTLRLGAQVRAHGSEIPCTVTVLGGGDGLGVDGLGRDGGVVDGEAVDAAELQLEVDLDEAVRGIATGQSVVLYDGTRVVGSATISATGRRARAGGVGRDAQRSQAAS